MIGDPRGYDASFPTRLATSVVTMLVHPIVCVYCYDRFVSCQYVLMMSHMSYVFVVDTTPSSLPSPHTLETEFGRGPERSSPKTNVHLNTSHIDVDFRGLSAHFPPSLSQESFPRQSYIIYCSREMGGLLSNQVGVNCPKSIAMAEANPVMSRGEPVSSNREWCISMHSRTRVENISGLSYSNSPKSIILPSFIDSLLRIMSHLYDIYHTVRLSLTSPPLYTIAYMPSR